MNLRSKNQISGCLLRHERTSRFREAISKGNQLVEVLRADSSSKTG